MRKRLYPPFVLSYVLALIAGLVAFGIGIYRFSNGHGDWGLLAAGCIGIVAVLVTWPLALAIVTSGADQKDKAGDSMQSVIERLDQISILLNLMSEQQLLSDRAKAVAFREKDLDALRRAIQEEIGKHSWDAAVALVENMQSEFGYKVEADRFREEIQNKRQETSRRQIGEMLAVIDRHTRSEDWGDAKREAERLMHLFPDNEQVQQLPREIDNRRAAQKKRLMDSWHEAVNRHDVDGSIEILKQLDPYLSRAEAESMQEAARGVFKEKLNNLGKEFSNAVQDHKWLDAIRLGELIMQDFPNTRIAQEVREKMDALRTRANPPAAAATT